VDALAWSPDAKHLAVAVNGELQVYNAAGADGAGLEHRYLTGTGIIGVDWSLPLNARSLDMVKAGKGPQPFVDALLAATKLPAAADTLAARPVTRVYLWQFDSSKPSPIAAIATAAPAVLQQYPPLPAGVVFHHWAPLQTWQLLGGCNRYRVVIAGSIAPTASTIGLQSSVLCNAPVAPSASPSV
jgi:hypothetical protein